MSIQKISDGNGNIIIADRQEFNVYLDLICASENRRRSIGFIQLATRTLFVKRESKHLHRKSNSYGFNYKVIKEAKIFDYINIRSPEGTFVISREKILSEGFIMRFGKRGDGFELQIFLTLDKLRKL